MHLETLLCIACASVCVTAAVITVWYGKLAQAAMDRFERYLIPPVGDAAPGPSVDVDLGPGATRAHVLRIELAPEDRERLDKLVERDPSEIAKRVMQELKDLQRHPRVKPAPTEPVNVTVTTNMTPEQLAKISSSARGRS